MNKTLIVNMVLSALDTLRNAVEVANENPEVWEIIKKDFNHSLSEFEKAAKATGKLNQE